jgi:hypothetical protein
MTYEFPAMPEVVGNTEDFNRFSRECSAVLKRRSDFVDFSSPKYTEYQNAHARFNIARLEEDYELIAAYSRFLLHGYSTIEVKTSMAALQLVGASIPLWRAVTAEHLDAYRVLYEAIDEVETARGMPESRHRMVGKLPIVVLCFADLSMKRAETIAMIIRRGITRAEDISAALSDFTMLTPSLLEGAL